jgi:hypothetical protein
MADTLPFELAPVFLAIKDAMQQSRLEFNQADSANGNHGDHMVEIFGVAVQAAQERQAEGLAEAMSYAGDLLWALPENGSAQVYAHGLAKLGEQFGKYKLTLEDLVPYLRKVLKDETLKSELSAVSQNGAAMVETSARSGDVLKALVTALAAWQQAESGQEKPVNPLGLGYMFDLGIAYLQARQRNSGRAEVIADAAATVSPLGKVSHRYQSGKIVIFTLLQALVNTGY